MGCRGCGLWAMEARSYRVQGARKEAESRQCLAIRRDGVGEQGRMKESAEQRACSPRLCMRDENKREGTGFWSACDGGGGAY